MNQLELKETIELIREAKAKKINIHYSNKELILRFPKGIEIDELIFNKLKKYKAQLIKYFEDDYNNNILNDERNQKKLLLYRKDKINYQRNSYYELDVRHNQHWWISIDEDITFKQNAIKIIKYRILGDFNIEAFKAAFKHLIKRHETLRTTFHQINNLYYARIEDYTDPIFKVIYEDYSTIQNVTERIENLDPADQEFDFKLGPLFLIRLLKICEKEYIIFFKLHHIIYDGWSIEVIIRDLLIFYHSFFIKTKPILPVLKYQYKDYMYFERCYRETYFEAHKNYWHGLYKTVPAKLIFPSSRRDSNAKLNKECASQKFTILRSLKADMSNLAKKYSVSMFVIFQSAFNSFIYKITGNNDLIFATQTFGRENFNDSGEQVGLFTAMYLIRSIIKTTDSFADIITTVKKSNEDMKKYRACRLEDALYQMLPNRNSIRDFFNVVVNYEEGTGYYVKRDNYNYKLYLNFEPIVNNIEKVHINCDFELKFINHEDHLNLIVSYNRNFISSVDAINLIEKYILHLEELCKNLCGEFIYNEEVK